MSIQVRAAEIHADSALLPDALLKRAREIAVDPDLQPLTIIKLGSGAASLAAHVPTLEALAAVSAAQRVKLLTAARVLRNVSSFALGVATKMKAGSDLLSALQDPDLLANLAAGLIPGTNAKTVKLALQLGHDLLSFVLEPGKKSGLPLLKDLGGVAGMFATKNPLASVTDILLSGVGVLVSGQDLDLARFLPGAGIALAKDLTAQASALTSDARGDL